MHNKLICDITLSCQIQEMHFKSLFILKTEQLKSGMGFSNLKQHQLLSKTFFMHLLAIIILFISV